MPSRVVERREAGSLHAVESSRADAGAQAVEIVRIGVECEFVIVLETVEADVLSQTGAGSVVERVCQRVLARHIAPDGLLEILRVTVVGDSVFVAFQTVFEDIFRNLAEVKIKVSAFQIVVFRIQEWIQ